MPEIAAASTGRQVSAIRAYLRTVKSDRTVAPNAIPAYLIPS
jgi:hypothetical protein